MVVGLVDLTSPMWSNLVWYTGTGTGTGSSASSGGGSNSNPSHHSSQQSHPSQHQPFNNNGNNSSGGSGTIHPYHQQSRMRHSSSISSSSEFTSVSQQVPNVGGAAAQKMPQSVSSRSPSRSGSDKEPDRVSSNASHDTRKMSVGSLASSIRRGGGSGRNLGVSPHLVQSRESFQIALDNPVPLYFWKMNANI